MSAVTRPIGRALGLSRTPAPPGPSQEELDAISERERRANEEEAEERNKLASQRIARRRGSRRNQLMSQMLSLIHISEPTRLTMISYAVFCFAYWTFFYFTTFFFYLDQCHLTPLADIKTFLNFSRVTRIRSHALGLRPGPRVLCGASTPTTGFSLI